MATAEVSTGVFAGIRDDGMFGLFEFNQIVSEALRVSVVHHSPYLPSSGKGLPYGSSPSNKAAPVMVSVTTAPLQKWSGTGAPAAPAVTVVTGGTDTGMGAPVAPGVTVITGSTGTTGTTLLEDVRNAICDDYQVTFAEFRALIAKHGGSHLSEAQLRHLYSCVDSFDARSVCEGVRRAINAAPPPSATSPCGGSQTGCEPETPAPAGEWPAGFVPKWQVPMPIAYPQPWFPKQIPVQPISYPTQPAVSPAVQDAMADGKVNKAEFLRIARDAISAAGLPRDIVNASGLKSIFRELRREGLTGSPAEIQKGINLAVCFARDIHAL